MGDLRLSKTTPPSWYCVVSAIALLTFVVYWEAPSKKPTSQGIPYTKKSRWQPVSGDAFDFVKYTKDTGERVSDCFATKAAGNPEPDFSQVFLARRSVFVSLSLPVFRK